MQESEIQTSSAALESISTALEPDVAESIFAVTKTIFSLSGELLDVTGDEVERTLQEGLTSLCAQLAAECVWLTSHDNQLSSLGGADCSSCVGTDCPRELIDLDFWHREGLEQRLADGEVLHVRPEEGSPIESDQVPADVPDGELVLVPLRRQNQFDGVLGIYRSAEVTALDPAMITHLERAGDVFRGLLMRWEMEEALDVSQRRYQTLVDTIEEVIFETDSSGRWTFLSEYWRTLTGTDPDASLGEAILDTVEGDHPRLEGVLLGRVGGDETSEFEVRMNDDEGDGQWVRVALQPVYSASGKFDGTLGSIRDASSVRKTFADLQQVDRMVNFGTLAAGIGHELNNPLAFVLGNLDFAQSMIGQVEDLLEETSSKYDDPGLAQANELVGELGDATRDMKDGAQRLRDIVADLRIFTSVDESEPASPTDLRESVESAISIGFSEVRHRATLIREFQGRLPLVSVNQGRMSQVFLNLIVNAAQAFEREGHEKHRIRVRLCSEDDWVIAEIEDNGPGMSEAEQDRIFEAFYSTKAATKGTGLGLSICRTLVEAEGGTIEVESEPGEGALFRVRLPAAEQGEESTESRDQSHLTPTGDLPRLRVLVVDDEPAVSRTIQRMLGPEHELTTVSDARIAVEALRAGEEFDVLLSDIIMPRMDGDEFLETITEEFPQYVPRCIFMTGGAATDLVSRVRENASQPILEKPFTRRELRDACANLVRALVDADEDGPGRPGRDTPGIHKESDPGL